MSNLDVSVLIKLVDQMTGPIRRMVSSVRGQIKSISESFKKFGTSLSKVGKEAKQLGVKMLAGAGVMTFAFKRMFVDTAAEFERYQIMLKSLEGSNAKAEKAMDWVSDFATRAPLQLNELMQGYVKLRTFGLDPTNGSLQSLVDMNAKMGGSNDTLQGMILAVGQAWTKQKLQGEEALQLIERGVPVWDLLAKATKLNVQQVQKLSSAGKLGRGAIKLLLEEIGKSSAGAAADQAKTWSGMVSMISDQWIRFANLVMSNGVFDWLKEKLSGFLALLNDWADSGKLNELAKQVGDNLVSGLKTLWLILQDLWEMIRFAAGGLTWLRDLFGSWKPVIIGLVGILAGPLLLAMAGATKAVFGLGIALMATPIGWFMAAVAAIVGVVVLIYKKWEPIKQFFTGIWDWIKDTFAVGVDFLKKVFEFTPLGMLIKGIGKLREIFGGQTSFAASQTSVQTISAGAASSQVSGTIKVQVEGNGARVTEMQSTGGIDMEAESGMAFGGAGL